jgi:hypothetical protein
MIDPVMFRQLTEIRHQERLERYTCRRQRGPKQETAQPTVPGRVRRAWAAVLTHLSLAPGR